MANKLFTSTGEISDDWGKEYFKEATTAGQKINNAINLMKQAKETSKTDIYGLGATERQEQLQEAKSLLDSVDSSNDFWFSDSSNSATMLSLYGQLSDTVSSTVLTKEFKDEINKNLEDTTYSTYNKASDLTDEEKGAFQKKYENLAKDSKIESPAEVAEATDSSDKAKDDTAKTEENTNSEKTAEQQQQESEIDSQIDNLVSKTKTKTRNGNNIDTSASNMLEMYQAFLSASLKESTSNSSSEIINVLSDFYWNINKTASSASNESSSLSMNASIPFVYVSEKQQTYSSQLTNVLNSLISGKNMLGKLGDAATNVVGKGIGNYLAEQFSNLANALNFNSSSSNDKSSTATNNNNSSVYNTVYNALKSLGDLVNIYEKSHLNTSVVLYPYLYLYATIPTNKFYVFPSLTNDSSLLDISNTYGDSGGGMIGTGMMDDLNKIFSGLNSISEDLRQYTSIIGKKGSTSFTSHQVETGKFYQFNTDGDSITVTFPLLNTVAPDCWKAHHRFLMMFALRNLPFKVDSTSYKNPLLYDVVVPGVRRLPMAYVEKFRFEPRGVIRPLSGTNYVAQLFGGTEDSSTTMVYNIPEAWIVSITFKDTLSRTSNKVLSALLDNAISTSTTSTSE